MGRDVKVIFAHFFVRLKKILKEEKVEKNSKNFQKSIDKNIRGGGKITFGYIYVKIF